MTSVSALPKKLAKTVDVVLTHVQFDPSMTWAEVRPDDEPRQANCTIARCTLWGDSQANTDNPG